MVQVSAEELERRLAAGESLTPGEVATLLGRGYSRTTVHRMLERGEIGFTLTGGGRRLCDPDDVRKVLARARTVHHGSDGGPAPTQTHVA
jgi:excisionase family DNA binding protein